MGWDGPILTDSGGFQLFSLAHRIEVTDQEAVFRSHIDGRLVAISPERAVAIQEAVGQRRGDGAGPRRGTAQRRRRSSATPPSAPSAGPGDAATPPRGPIRRCSPSSKAGSTSDLRVACARQLREMDFAGYAVGGLSVGEAPADMLRILEATVPELPADRPRYLMGVGRPEDLLEAIHRGIDLFDCVMPTRNGRNSMAFTDAGTLRLRNAKYERDRRPLARADVLARPAGAAGLPPPPVHGRRDARPDPAVDPQSDLLSAAALRRPRGHRGRSI